MVVRYRERLPNVDVKITFVGGPPEQGRFGHTIRANLTNLGLVDEYFKHGCCGIQFEGDASRTLFPMEGDNQLPPVLKPGESFQLVMPVTSLPELFLPPGKRRFRVAVTDAAGRDIFGDWTEDGTIKLQKALEILKDFMPSSR